MNTVQIPCSCGGAIPCAVGALIVGTPFTCPHCRSELRLQPTSRPVVRQAMDGLRSIREEEAGPP